MSEPLDLLWVDPFDFGANAPRVNAWRERGGDQDVPYRRADWRPIETAPKDGTDILIWSRAGREIGKYLAGREAWLGHGDNGSGWRTPTHWQPLPEPPDA